MKFSTTALALLAVSLPSPFSHSGKASALTFVGSAHAKSIQHCGSQKTRPFATTIPKMSTTAEPETTTTNPLLEYKSLPKFTKIEPSQLTPAVTSSLSSMLSQFETLESKLSSSDTPVTDFDAVLPEIERFQAPLEFTWGIAGHLNGVKNSPELRAEYEKNQPEVVKATSKLSQSRAVYDALTSIRSSLPDGDDFLVAQKRRAVDNAVRGMKLGGVGLEGAEKDRFNEIRTRLAELSTKFSNNVLDATKAFGLVVEDADVVEGVPDSAKGMWHGSYLASLESEGGEKTDEDKGSAESGPWRITLDAPSYIAAMQHVKDRTVREKIYKEYITRASEKTPALDNAPLITEILTLKGELTKLLGFSNYAEQSLHSKMAPSVDAVKELSELIKEKALPAAYKELDEITAYARANGGEEYTSLEKLEPWDVTYWSERLKESKFSLTEEELRPYFALPNVLNGMFDLVNRIFSIKVTRVEEDVELWHPDVSFYHVTDAESGVHIASFYLDPYSRPADKRGGAWMDVCLGKTSAVEGREIPVAYLTCNGTPPAKGKPSLMTFREVETLFHEFGHGLQHMLTKVEVGDVAGINGVEWDAVELPSQFMENWCYDEPTVYGFAKHYETGEPLPKDLFEKLKQQKTYGAGMMAMRQLYFGMLDMELHANYDPTKSEQSVFDIQKEVAAIYSPYNLPLEEDRFLCTFSHIFAGGYAAGYYSYKWAEVMSADAFGAFEDVGLDNEEKVKEVGLLFRDTVLSLGGAVEPMEVFRRFRGREPTPDALLRHNGLA